MYPLKLDFSYMTLEEEFAQSEIWWTNECDRLKETKKDHYRDLVGHIMVPSDLVIKFKAFLSPHFYGFSKYAVTKQLAEFISFLVLTESKEEAAEVVKYSKALQEAIWILLGDEKRRHEIGEKTEE